MTKRKRNASLIDYAEDGLLGVDGVGLASAVQPRPGRSICYDFESYESIFAGMSPEYLTDISEECKRVFAVKELSQNSNYSEGKTLFVRDVDADAAGLSLLESLALQIFRHHTRDIVCDPARSGAEFWTQCIDFRDDIGLHFDKDYSLEEITDGEINAYPLFSTVTYIQSNGGATLVFDKKGPARNSEGVEAEGIKKLIVSRPVSGKHIKFDGSLLHFAPSTLHNNYINEEEEEEDGEEEEEEGMLRVTFLVNIWVNHIPLGCIGSGNSNASRKSSRSNYSKGDADKFRNEYKLDFCRLRIPDSLQSSILKREMNEEKEPSSWLLYHGDDINVVEVPLVSLLESGYCHMDLLEIDYSDFTGSGICIRKVSDVITKRTNI